MGSEQGARRFTATSPTRSTCSYPNLSNPLTMYLRQAMVLVPSGPRSNMTLLITVHFFILLAALTQGSRALSPNGTNVCSNTCTRTFKERVQTYKRCGLFGWRRCLHYQYKISVRNETCYDCCPGWLQTDNDNCRTAAPCPTGAAGIRSCEDLPDGNYQACEKCHVYATCTAGVLADSRPCCCGLVWDDLSKRCEWNSQTCHQATTTGRPSTGSPGVTSFIVTSPRSTTQDPDGVWCNAANGCWAKTSFRYEDNWNDCHGDQYVRRTGHTFAKYVGVVLCSSERYKIFLGDHLKGIFQNVADGSGDGSDHCEFLGGKECQRGVRVATGYWKSPLVYGFYRQDWGEEPKYGLIGRGWRKPENLQELKEDTQRYYVRWYQCGVTIPGNGSVIELPDVVTHADVTSQRTRSVSEQTTPDVMTRTGATPAAHPDHHTVRGHITGGEQSTDTPSTSASPSMHQFVPPGSEHIEGSGSGSEGGSGYRSAGCDVTCSPPSVCVDLYGDDEDEPFSKCVCPPGMATLSEEPVCIEVDDCRSFPCKNGAQCVDKRNGYFCDCAPGWQGDNCDVMTFNVSQRPLCSHCRDYFRLSGSCSGHFCQCHTPRYNTFTCLPEVSGCTVLRNQSMARAKPEILTDRSVGVVYSCVPAPKSRSVSNVSEDAAAGRSPTFEAHALAIYRSTRGVVVVNVTWPSEAQSGSTGSDDRYVMLALSNYWPTSWVVVIPPWRQLGEVIVFSHAHRNTTVTVRRASADGRAVPVNTFHLHPASYPPGFGDDTHIDTNTPAMLDYLYAQYGTLASFTGTYQADRWQLRVGHSATS